MATLRQVFSERARDVIEKTKPHSSLWKLTDTDDCPSLEIRKVSNDGFDLALHTGNEEIIVLTEFGAHEHFPSLATDEEAVEAAFGFARDLLSDHMRIKEYRAGAHAYRWDIEALRGDAWARESTTGLLFWNYFGRRSFRYYSNGVLPGRLQNA